VLPVLVGRSTKPAGLDLGFGPELEAYIAPQTALYHRSMALPAAQDSFQLFVDAHFRGTFEIHIFVTPLNASPEVLLKFQQTCATRPRMKALYLYLVFEHCGPTGTPKCYSFLCLLSLTCEN
jgi:hypothetical protein